MAGKNATTSIFINKYRPDAEGFCSVSIRVTFERKKKYYPTPVNLLPEDFDKVQGAKPRNEFKEIALKLRAYENKAADVIDKLPFFTWKAFEKQYLVNRAKKDTLDSAFSLYAEELREAERIGTAVSYECAQSSLNKFAVNLRFADVTPEVLRRYEKWMLTNGKSITTVGIYLRALRTLFNNALAEGLLTKEYYPFGKRKYEIPTGNNIKKALTLKDIGSIFRHQLEPGSPAERARDYWIFMYLCNGINVKDLCLLTYDSLKEDVLEFERAKTIRTKRKVEPIRVALNDHLHQIIKKWGRNKKDGSTYIFPVLEPRLSAERERQLIQQLTQVINAHMKDVAKALEINKNVTTYAARHSFASVLQRSGVSTEFISEALGHTNVKTTQNYLAGFEDEHKREVTKALTAFDG
jgi:integrase/recombinase XerD